MAREEGLTERVHILAGITPLKSANSARRMATRVAGMDIPDDIIKRMAGVPKSQAVAEGIKICLETIQELRELEGVHGIHIMAIESEDKVGEIIEGAGLLPRPLVET